MMDQISWLVLLLTAITALENWYMHVIKKEEYAELSHWMIWLAEKYNEPRIIPILTAFFGIVGILIFEYFGVRVYVHFLLIGFMVVDIILSGYQILRKVKIR